MAKSKMIRVVSRGVVFTSRGRVISPIMYPYRESIDRIWNMIARDMADVDEQLPDGSFIRLTVQNYDKDNTVKHDVATKIPVQVVKPDENLKSDEHETNGVNDGTPDNQDDTMKVDSSILDSKDADEEPVEEHENEVPADNKVESDVDTNLEIAIEEPTDIDIINNDADKTDKVDNKVEVVTRSNKKNRKHNKNNQTNKVDGASISVSVEEV